MAKKSVRKSRKDTRGTEVGAAALRIREVFRVAVEEKGVWYVHMRQADIKALVEYVLGPEPA